MSNSEMEAGPQPLDALLEAMGVSNHEVVEASTEQLTHKMVAKARKGRKLTKNLQGKILNAMNALRGDRPEFTMEDLFNYRGR